MEFLEHQPTSKCYQIWILRINFIKILKDHVIRSIFAKISLFYYFNSDYASFFNKLGLI